MQLLGLLPAASNYTLLAKLVSDQDERLSATPAQGRPKLPPSGSGEQLVVYKPAKGETPLWDFPAGTLCRREVAAYLMAQAGGWDFIPPTILREGPLGLGAVQSFIKHDPSKTAFELIASHRAELKRIALFDIVANNADRKAGHILMDQAGKLWGVDHGLCFHQEPKLRTILWDFIGEHVSPEDLELVVTLCRFLRADPGELSELLSLPEVQALETRARRILDERKFPPPETSRPYPWPPI